MAEVKKLVKTENDLSPKPLLGAIKTFVTPGSTAGILRDRKKTLDEKMSKAGA